MAKYALQEKQEQLGLPTMSLLQSCKTRWNSSYLMLERLLQNRIPVMNVLTDRRSTTASVAESLEISEREWTFIEALVALLKPLQMATTVLCGDNSSPVSMVRPVLQKTLQNHMQIRDEDDVMIRNAKEIIANEITQRFDLTWISNNITARQIASMLDPRFKDLDHEPFEARLEIRSRVKNMLQGVAPVENTCSKVTKKIMLWSSFISKKSVIMTLIRNGNVICLNRNQDLIWIHLSGGIFGRINFLLFHILPENI